MTAPPPLGDETAADTGAPPGSPDGHAEPPDGSAGGAPAATAGRPGTGVAGDPAVAPPVRTGAGRATGPAGERSVGSAAVSSGGPGPGPAGQIVPDAQSGPAASPPTVAPPGAPAPPPPKRPWRRPDWRAIGGVLAKDVRAVSRAKAVVIPMLAVPVLLMVLLPGAIGIAARNATATDLSRYLDRLPGDVARPITQLPVEEQMIVLVNGYLLAPLFLIVPLMVSAVLAADAFAGEKERRTLESLLHSSISDRDLFLAKFLSAVLPAITISWAGFAAFVVVANGVAWPVMGRIFVPTQLWGVMIGYIAPGVATLGLSIMIRVSARTGTAQEANQLGGAVIVPLIFAAVGQSSALLLSTLPIAFAVGTAIWVVAIALLIGGMRRFTRDALVAQV